VEVIARQDSMDLSHIALFEQMPAANPTKQVIPHLYTDSARYYVSKCEKWSPVIHLHCLPPYSPNLNPHEQLWKFYARRK